MEKTLPSVAQGQGSGPAGDTGGELVWSRKGLTIMIVAQSAMIIISVLFSLVPPAASAMQYFWLTPMVLNVILCACARSESPPLSHRWLMRVWCFACCLGLTSTAVAFFSEPGPLATALMYPAMMFVLQFPSMYGKLEVAHPIDERLAERISSLRPAPTPGSGRG